MRYEPAGAGTGGRATAWNPVYVSAQSSTGQLTKACSWGRM